MTRTAFITGASSGLGRGLALHYARAGWTVHAAARRGEELEALRREAVAAGAPGRIAAVPLDVTDAPALAAALRDAERAAGGALDLVVANAGVGYFTQGRDLDWEGVKRLLDVNVAAACVTVSAALPAMVARGEGTVAAVSSLAGFRGLPGNAAYSASKAALRTFMESLRVHLRGSGVRVVTICPGFVKTPMTARNRFAMPFLMDLDEAVEAMARGLDRGDAEVVFPWQLGWLERALASLPRGAYERLARLAAPRR
jgi:NAD(P)-dependent dehydrogenase (short-subunit alcohol dehydrogenase family)